eukprot:1672222-Rhodomonas_salina.2
MIVFDFALQLARRAAESNTMSSTHDHRGPSPCDAKPSTDLASAVHRSARASSPWYHAPYCPTSFLGDVQYGERPFRLSMFSTLQSIILHLRYAMPEADIGVCGCD